MKQRQKGSALLEWTHGEVLRKETGTMKLM